MTASVAELTSLEVLVVVADVPNDARLYDDEEESWSLSGTCEESSSHGTKDFRLWDETESQSSLSSS